jgi:nitrogenase-associated protein
VVFKKVDIIFYEKRGCAGNKRQKALLESFGFVLDVRDILNTNWDKQTLESFFENADEIVNRTAPQVKKGEIEPDKLTPDELIEAMIKEPILIKRPLIQIGSTKICGFDKQKLNRALNIDIEADVQECKSTDKCNA